MTPTEVFEAWLTTYSERPIIGSTAERQFREAWLAACAWQREQDAKEAMKYQGSGQVFYAHDLPTQIADAIRRQP